MRHDTIGRRSAWIACRSGCGATIALTRVGAVGSLRLMPRSAQPRRGRHRFLACDVIEAGRQIARAQLGDERVDAHSGYNMVCQSSLEFNGDAVAINRIPYDGIVRLRRD